MRSNPIQAAQQTIETPVQALPVPLAPASVSPCEGFFCRAEERLPGAHRIIAVFRLDGFIDERICSAAIDHLQRRHPKLRAAIVRDPDGRLRYHFDREAPPIRRDFKDYDGTECSWREEARRLVRIPIPLTGPFIAFSVFRNRDLDKSVLIVCTHHGIADGISSMMLVDDLLTEYARIEAQSSAPTRPALEFVSVAHAAETPGWRKRWWLLRRFVRLRLKERRARQTALPESPKLQPIPQWEHWCFSAEETSTLVQRCRQEKASLAGVLVSAAYCSLMKCLPDSEALFRSQIPFSVRGTAESPAGKISPYDVGAFVGQMIEFHRVTKQTDFWELARSARESVKGFVDNGGPSLAYNLIALSEKQMLSQAGHKMRPSGEKRPTLLVTNYGTVRMGETYGSLRAREGITTFNNFPQGATLAIAALTMGGRLNVGLAAGTLEPTFWYLLRKEVRRHLDATMKPAGQG